jgi:hypothetical protein
VLPTNDALNNAFQLLASAVRDVHSKGRPCLAARLKPELRRRTNFSFSEQQLGFAKFGDFLRLAQNAGFIQLTPTPGGDWEVWPPGAARNFQPAPEPVFQGTAFPSAQIVHHSEESPIPRGIVRVRPDLWNAFNSFSSGWVYDRQKDMAYREHPGTSSTGGSEQAAGVDLIPIPAGRDRVVEWMRSFAKMQQPEAGTRLLGTLEGYGSTYQFNNAVRLDFKVHRAWREFHIRQVIAVVNSWAALNNVHPKSIVTSMNQVQQPLWVARPQQTPGSVPTFQSRPLPPQPTSVSVTPRLVTLIDHLIDELLRLRGTLQFIEPKH